MCDQLIRRHHFYSGDTPWLWTCAGRIQQGGSVYLVSVIYAPVKFHRLAKFNIASTSLYSVAFLTMPVRIVTSYALASLVAPLASTAKNFPFQFSRAT